MRRREKESQKKGPSTNDCGRPQRGPIVQKMEACGNEDKRKWALDVHILLSTVGMELAEASPSNWWATALWLIKRSTTRYCLRGSILSVNLKPPRGNIYVPLVYPIQKKIPPLSLTLKWVLRFFCNDSMLLISVIYLEFCAHASVLTLQFWVQSLEEMRWEAPMSLVFVRLGRPLLPLKPTINTPLAF